MICYYGKHYTAFFMNDDLGERLSFDDAQVTRIGPHWHSAIDLCKKSKFMPLLLFYELTDEAIPEGRGKWAKGHSDMASKEVQSQLNTGDDTAYPALGAGGGAHPKAPPPGFARQ